MLTLNVYDDFDYDDDENKMYILLLVNNFLYEAIILIYLNYSI
jgi:hypothetical protein